MRLCLALGLLACAVYAASGTGYGRGQLHPDFRLPRVDRDGFARLSDFRGKKVLLFNFASW